MALIGRDGTLQLTRSFPCPVLLPATALDVANNRFTVNSDAFWPGDEVVLVHSGGTKTGFVWRDTLDRITLHTTAVGAQDNTVGTRVSLSGVPAAFCILCLKGATAATTVLTTLYPKLNGVSQETELTAYPAAFEDYQAANASTTVWVIQGLIKRWTLKLGGNVADTSSIGERFGESIRAAVTGTGNLDFLVDFAENSSGVSDIDQILRMALMIEGDATAQARFYLKKRRTASSGSVDGNLITPLPGSVFYSSQILLIETSIDATGDDFIQGSANFATLGPVRLFRE